jgi:adenylate kinase
LSYTNHDPVRQRRIVIVGIPGVGKSTVVTRVVEILKEKGEMPKLVNFGTVMLEEAARSKRVKSRDEIRRLPIDTQKNLQVHAASEISRMDGEYVFVDTHLFISTGEGFWPGIPIDVLQALKPTNLILLTAKPEEILRRRKKDVTRTRDPTTNEFLQKEMFAANSLLYASAIITGCPALIVENPEGTADEAALKIVAAVTSS